MTHLLQRCALVTALLLSCLSAPVHATQSEDCNANGVPDFLDADCDLDGIPDDCEGDCNGDGLRDGCELSDCNANGTPDVCEPDCDGDGEPDACGLDCDSNGVPDLCESDCDGNGEPDPCGDCDADGIPDICEVDCNGDGIPEDCQVFGDCDGDGIPNACEEDCDGDGLQDSCAPDCDWDGVADYCEDDLDGNGTPDDCDPDCDGDGVIDGLDPDVCMWTFESVDQVRGEDTAAGDRLGRAVALSGDTAAISAPGKDEGGLEDSGAVYVFVREDGTWVQQAKLVASDPDAQHGFGESVALYGDTLAVGARYDDEAGEDSGAVYLFRRFGYTWVQERKLRAPEPQLRGWGGFVSLYGNRLGVSPRPEFDFPLDGDLWTYRREGSSWELEARLLGRGKVVLFQDRAVTGWVVYDLDAGGSLEGVIGFDDPVSVAFHGDSAAMLCEGASCLSLFRRVNGDWKRTDSESAPVLLSEPRENLLALSRDLLAVGRPALMGSPGSIQVYQRRGHEWTERLTITLPGGDLLDGFGRSVAMEGDLLVGGAPLDDSSGEDAGSAAFFQLRPSSVGTRFCMGSACPCGNDDTGAGCLNSLGEGALLGSAGGSTSVSVDDLVLRVSGHPPNNSALFFMGSGAETPVLVGDGKVCTGGLFRFAPGTVSNAGELSLSSPVGQVPARMISAGDSRAFQSWSRDVLCGPPPSPCPSPCGTGSNLSNAIAITFTP